MKRIIYAVPVFVVVLLAAAFVVVRAAPPMMNTATPPATTQADPSLVPERILGKVDAPVTLQEFVSLTCPHCAEFYKDTLPKIKEKYVDTGKVRLILRDFPIDGIALKAAALARCMPADEYYAFINVLFSNQTAWALVPDPAKVLVQYAKLGGLDEDKAKACLNDTKMQDAIIAAREQATKQYTINATPTFVVNDTDKIEGGQPIETFSAIIDKTLLTAKK